MAEKSKRSSTDDSTDTSIPTVKRKLVGAREAPIGRELRPTPPKKLNLPDQKENE